MRLPLPWPWPPSRWVLRPVATAGVLLVLASGFVFGSMAHTGVFAFAGFFRPGIYIELSLVLYLSAPYRSGWSRSTPSPGSSSTC